MIDLWERNWAAAVVNNNTKAHWNRCSCSSCAQYVFWLNYCRLSSTRTRTNSPVFVCALWYFSLSSPIHTQACISHMFESAFPILIVIIFIVYKVHRTPPIFLSCSTRMCSVYSFHLKNWNKQTFRKIGIISGSAATAVAFIQEMHYYAMMNKCLFHFK